MNLSARGHHEVGAQVRTFEPDQVGFVPRGMMAFHSQGLKVEP